MPISGNPCDIIAFRFRFRWNFIDGFRDVAIHSNSSGRFLAHLCCKGFMDRAACQNLEVFASCVIGLGRLFWDGYDGFLCPEVVAAEYETNGQSSRLHVLNSHSCSFRSHLSQFFATGCYEASRVPKSSQRVVANWIEAIFQVLTCISQNTSRFDTPEHGQCPSQCAA